MMDYIYDTHNTRKQLYKSIDGAPYQWLFLPGGPGVDSSCLIDLLDQLHFPGEYWLIDFAMNGSNHDHADLPHNSCEYWPIYLTDLVTQFNNPILVGHSFGAYLPLFCPKLEKSLKALLLFNSTPTLQSDIFSKVVEENQLPPLQPLQQQFVSDPTLENLQALYTLEAHYFFTEKNREKGIQQVIDKLQYCLATEHWWYDGGASCYSDITWVPEKVPTLIIAGEHDYITPLALFEEDQRFQRDNIHLQEIHGAGHFPWVDQPKLVEDTVECFLQKIIS